MNSYHLNIYYTSNRENQNKILRLYFPIGRSDRKFTLSKSPQEKIRGFYIHFESVYLGILKKGVIQPFLHLKYMTCFDYSHLKIVFIKLVWKKNFFSVIFCWQMWETFSIKYFSNRKSNKEVPKRKKLSKLFG